MATLRKYAPTITYIKGPFKGANRAKRRVLEAQARHKGESSHELGSLPAPPKRHIAQPHEARHVFSHNGRYPLAWNGEEQ
jgi:hypothetical protein